MTAGAPQVSVVMPVHNKAPHVGRAIESVLQQSGPALELIVVDDASTDDSLARVRAFDDPRIRVCRRTSPGIGGYAARNAGVQAAAADWVAFLDADDAWRPGHLAAMWALSSRFPTAELLAAGWSVSDGRHETLNDYLSHAGTAERSFDLGAYLHVHARGLDIVHTNVVLMRRELLERIGGFPEPSATCRRAGDGQTWLRAMMSGATLAWSPHVGATYYQDAVNTVTRAQRYEVREHCLISYIDACLARTPGHPLAKALRAYRDERAMSVLFQNARNAAVDGAIVREALQTRCLDRRFPFILAGCLAPHWTARLIARLKTGPSTA